MNSRTEDGGKPHLHKSPSGSSGTCASTHESQQLLPMLRYFLHVLAVECDVAPSQIIRNPKVLSPIFADPCSEKMRSPNSSARRPLTRDLSGLGFTELQNGHVLTTC